MCNGTISHKPNGNGGFGYDPIFDCNGKSFAELTAEEKTKSATEELLYASYRLN